MVRNKYNAKKTQRLGFTFDSLWEADRYSELRLLELAGCISELKVKPKPALSLHDAYLCARTSKMVRASTYQPDFSYIDGSEGLVYEDAKGVATAASKLKRKIVEAQHGVVVWFVYRNGRTE